MYEKAAEINWVFLVQLAANERELRILVSINQSVLKNSPFCCPLRSLFPHWLKIVVLSTRCTTTLWVMSQGETWSKIRNYPSFYGAKKEEEGRTSVIEN